MNNNQTVELNDFTYVAQQYGVTAADADYEEMYDVNASGAVDDADLDIISSYLFAESNVLPELVQAERTGEKAVNSAYLSSSTTTIRTAAYEYDKAGNLVKQTDTNGRSVCYTYDAHNRLIRITDKEGNTSRSFYDEAGNKIKEVSPQNYNPSTDDGPGITYLYDAMNRLLEVRNEAGTVVSKNTYDISGLVAASTDAAGYATEYAYDIGYRVLQITAPEAKLKGRTSISYTYDALGNIKTVTDGEGNTTAYIRDMWGRAVKITNADGSYELYTYDFAGNMTSSRDGNGNTTYYSYNSLNKLAAITDPAGQTISYKYDREGRLVFEADRNGQNITYTYDELSRLVSENSTTYSYDKAGNRTSKATGTDISTYTYDTRNRMTQSTAGGVTTTYSYDNNGNLLTTSDGKVYTYDGFNRLTKATNSDGTWQANIYGPDGLRMAVLENGIYTGFVNNGGDVISEHNAQGSLKASFLRGIGLAAKKDSQGSLSYFLQNAHGDVTALAAADGSILNSYSYDAFGNAISSNVTAENRFMYSGEQYDSITGEYYLRARFYNPVLGRFMQEDSYRGDGLNLYAYVSNNPLRYVDPSGHGKKAQQYLSELGFDIGKIDGIWGTMSSTATKAFQQIKGLKITGKIDKETLEKMRESVLTGERLDLLVSNYYDTTLKSNAGFIQLLEMGNGYMVVNNWDGNENWGTPSTISSLVSIANQWSQNNDVLLEYNDISKKEGGLFRPHVSHQKGKDIDIRPIRNDGKNGGTDINSSTYSREGTRELIKLLLADPNTEMILFNDEALIEEFRNNSAGVVIK
ncbi:MAG: penicillin-insensitive murein endopeptidase [Bacillota bacterium]